MKRLLLFFLLILPLFGSEIKRYEVNMHLLKNGKLNVKEVIYYFFDNEEPHHGIFRDIPLKINYKHDLYILPFNNLKVLQDDKNATFSANLIEKNGFYMHIKVGSPKKSVSGLHKYTLIYDTILPTFPAKNEYEKISINAIGSWWEVPIKKVIFKLILPKNLSKEKVKAKGYIGYYHSFAANAKISWEDNHTIKIIAKDLDPYMGVTLDLYFSKGAIISSLHKVPFLKRFWHWLLLIPIVWYLYFITKNYHYKDNAPIVVEYQPPKNISILEAALLYDTTISNDIYPAAIIELANKGKITIDYQDGKTVLKVKNGDVANLSPDLQMLFYALFKNGDSFVLKKNDKNNYGYLKRVFDTIDEYLEKIEVKKGYVLQSFKKTDKTFLLKSLFIYIPLLLFAFYDIHLHHKFYGNYIAILGPLLVSIVTLGFLKFKNVDEFMLVLFSAISLVYILFSYGSGWREFYLGPTGVLLVFSFIWSFFYIKAANYSKKGLQLKNYLEGLREFIKRAKKDQIEALLKEDPNFLDKLLPYAILFGLNKHWLEFYEIFKAQPKWFKGDFYYLGTFYSDFEESTGAGFSGGAGGFSGGGALGGGGGDW